MANIESLPCELLHLIFAIAYEDAASDDRDLNLNIRTYIKCSRGYNRLAMPITPYLDRMLRSRYNINFSYPAPAIYKLTASLLSVYLDIKDDIDFVANKALIDFMFTMNCDNEDSMSDLFFITSKQIYAQQAKEKGHLYQKAAEPLWSWTGW